MDQLGCESALKSYTNAKHYYYCNTIMSKSSTQLLTQLINRVFKTQFSQWLNLELGREKKERLSTSSVVTKVSLLINTDKKNIDSVLMLHSII